MKSYLFLSSTYTSILVAKLLLSYNFGGRLNDLYSDNQIFTWSDRVSQSKKLSQNSNSRLQTHAELNSITSEKHHSTGTRVIIHNLWQHINNYRQSHKITSQIISRLRSHLRSQTGLTPNRKRGTCRGIHTQRRDSFSFTHSQPQHVQSSSTHPKRCRLGTGGRLRLVHTHPLCEALLLAMELPRGQNRQKSPFAKLAPGHTRLSPSGSRPQATPEAALSQNWVSGLPRARFRFRPHNYRLGVDSRLPP